MVKLYNKAAPQYKLNLEFKDQNSVASIHHLELFLTGTVSTEQWVQCFQASAIGAVQIEEIANKDVVERKSCFCDPECP